MEGGIKQESKEKQEVIEEIDNLLNILNQIKSQIENDDFDKEEVGLWALTSSLKEFSGGLTDFPKKK